MKVYLETHETIILADEAFSSGGEGEVRKVIDAPAQFNDACVKIYFKNKRTSFQERKLRYMVANPPARIRDNGFLIGWPLKVIFDVGQSFIGFLMPMAPPDSQELVNLTATTISRRLSPDWHQRFDRRNGKYAVLSRLKLMKNIAIPIHLLHETGKYVLMDFKPQNVLVTYTGAVTLVDIDSIQICEAGNLLFPATGRTEFYMPPEYYSHGIGRDPEIPIDTSWDNFAIGVVFYQILFGLHPYIVTPIDIEDEMSSEIPQNIERNLFPFGENARLIQSYPDPHNKFRVLPDRMQNLFKSAFSAYPHMRPRAKDWGQVLHEEIKKCPAIPMPPRPDPDPSPMPGPAPQPNPEPDPEPTSVVWKVFLTILLLGSTVGVVLLVYELFPNLPTSIRFVFYTVTVIPLLKKIWQ